MMKNLEKRFLSGDFHPKKKRQALRDVNMTDHSVKRRKKSNQLSNQPTGTILSIGLPSSHHLGQKNPVCPESSPEVEYQGSEILAPQVNNENDMSLVSVTKKEKCNMDDNTVKDMSLVSAFKGNISDTISSGLTDNRSQSSLSYGIAIDLLEEKTDVFETQLKQIFQRLDAIEHLIKCPNSSIGWNTDAGIISTPLSSKMQPPPFNPPPVCSFNPPPANQPVCSFDPQQANQPVCSFDPQQANQPVCSFDPPQANQPVYPVNPAGNLSDSGSMVTSEQIKLKYPGLHSEAKIGSMAVKLAKESIFGEEIMRKSTVKGCRNLAPLPENGLLKSKESLLAVFPQYWDSPTLFEPLWAKSLEAVGQACKRLRNAK